ncbi:hypothetical protein SAMIE_1008510 [Sphingobium amiense]|uniref:DUF11 domain-containing protein n=1 Tax=Sphingobium amiense TaxID=135719 RepID=A0A494W9N9_9SPHN|nr:hypothetical protein [Sphingobium amiense]BBD97350.1 hypothetical protein SAMIE_1008510 [Sphingobium amiense]
MKRVSLAVAAALLCTAAEGAPSPVRLDTQMFVERVGADINGRPRRTLVPVDQAAPGDSVIVILNWRNGGTRPVRAFTLRRSALRGATPDLNDPALLVSVDGGARWGRFDSLWLPTPLGGIRRALPQDVTHIRWTLPDPVSPGGAARMSYRATLR